MSLQETLKHHWRVLMITKKPDKQEYFTVVKATAMGIGIIGFIGFILAIVNQVII